ncbi:MAG: BTAD domain-containing putative transcriptional regulator [Caldilineaceae bacterium]
MQQLIIKLFGSLEIQLNGEAVDGFRSNKARALLAYLAVEANRPVARTRLATLLWGDYPDAQARKSLRNVLANLRQILTPAGLAESPHLTIDRQTVQLTVDGDSCQVDVVRFDECVRNAQAVASVTSKNALLAEAAALYRGELLAELSDVDSPDFEEWRVFQQEARHRQFMQALQQLTAAAIDEADYATAHGYAQRQLQLEPWQESAHRQLMHILALQGDRGAALSQFAACQRALAAELGVAPDAETMALYEQIKVGEVLRKGEGEKGGRGDVRSTIYDLRTEPVTQAIVNRKSDIVNHLDPLPDQRLFGIEAPKARLLEVLNAAGRPWLAAIDGIGGIGKTTLATLLVHELLPSNRFAHMAWVSAKQEEFRPAVGIAAINNGITGRPALDVETLTNALLEQLMERPPLTAALPEKQAALTSLLKAQPHLIVVDNLETVADYQALIPFLRQLANPSKFLVTTRFTLQAYSDIFCYSLTELPADEVHAFIRYDAAGRNIQRLANASDEQLQSIYEVVGGNPLALKLVIGQAAFLPLSQVLENLQLAQGKKIDQLYIYIYWQAWEMLDAAGRQLFLAMPAVDDGTFMELVMVSGLDPDETQEALVRLIDLSLVQTGGDLDEPRYRLHRLTETFLMHEVLKWQEQ